MCLRGRVEFVHLALSLSSGLLCWHIQLWNWELWFYWAKIMWKRRGEREFCLLKVYISCSFPAWKGFWRVPIRHVLLWGLLFPGPNVLVTDLWAQITLRLLPWGWREFWKGLQYIVWSSMQCSSYGVWVLKCWDQKCRNSFFLVRGCGTSHLIAGACTQYRAELALICFGEPHSSTKKSKLAQLKGYKYLRCLSDKLYQQTMECRPVGWGPVGECNYMLAWPVP